MSDSSQDLMRIGPSCGSWHGLHHDRVHLRHEAPNCTYRQHCSSKQGRMPRLRECPIGITQFWLKADILQQIALRKNENPVQNGTCVAEPLMHGLQLRLTGDELVFLLGAVAAKAAAVSSLLRCCLTSAARSPRCRGMPRMERPEAQFGRLKRPEAQFGRLEWYGREAGVRAPNKRRGFDQACGLSVD